MPYDISKKILFLILLPDVIMRIITWSIHNIFNRRFRFTVSVICYMVKYFLPGVFPIKIWWDKKTIDINIKHIALACFWRVTNNIPFNIAPSFFDFFLHSFHSLFCMAYRHTIRLKKYYSSLMITSLALASSFNNPVKPLHPFCFAKAIRLCFSLSITRTLILLSLSCSMWRESSITPHSCQ